ncbi:MAG TPA: hypothetical protein VFG05_00760 [Methylocella sp.]|nr:hypothetical protein [Methylocella sp.]
MSALETGKDMAPPPYDSALLAGRRQCDALAVDAMEVVRPGLS